MRLFICIQISFPIRSISVIDNLCVFNKFPRTRSALRAMKVATFTGRFSVYTCWHAMHPEDLSFTDCALQSLQGSGQLPSPTGEVCFACSCPITDRFLLRTAGRSWHERCLSCSVCGEQLTTSCFAKEGKLLCRQDYVRWEHPPSLNPQEDNLRIDGIIQKNELLSGIMRQFFSLICSFFQVFDLWPSWYML